MSLYHFDYNKDLKPENLLDNPYILLLGARCGAEEFNELVSIFDGQIAAIAPSKKSALSFAMLATLVGYKADCTDKQYVWDTVFKAAKGHDKTANYMLGCLAQWRFSVDTRKWLCCKQDQNKTNEDGEDVFVTIYWVSDRN